MTALTPDFASLCLPHYESVRRILYARCGGALAQEVDDLTQETFRRAWAAWSTWRPEAKPMTWLMTIASNLRTNEIRNGRRRPAVSVEDVHLTARDDPAHHAEVSERLDRARRVIATMPRGEQAALQRVANGERDVSQTHKSALWRARRRLRESEKEEA